MSLRLEYWVSIDKEGKFLLAFYTKQIDTDPSVAHLPPVTNEVQFGNVFSEIKAHGRVSIVIPKDNYHVVHKFMETPQNQAVLELSIQFSRVLEHQDYVAEWVGEGGKFIPEKFGKSHWQRSQCYQTIMNLRLQKAALQSFLATENETFTANFRVTGGSAAEYFPEAECEKWNKL